MTQQNQNLPEGARELPQPSGLAMKEVGRTIKAGDVVQEIGHATRMTVREIVIDGYVCDWFEGDEYKTDKFAPGSLRLAPPLVERVAPQAGYFLGTPERLAIARVIYEANRAYALTLGDTSFGPFDDAPDWQIETILKGIDAFTSGEVIAPHESHDSWLREKVATGWSYGPVKDAEAKTHPCMLPYDELPASQRRKDHLFLAIVRALTKDIG